jgi:hypothetical protein
LNASRKKTQADLDEMPSRRYGALVMLISAGARQFLVLASALAIGLVGCASSDDPADESASSDVSAAATSRAPGPFLMQYVGTYKGPSGGQFDSLDLLRDGSFIAVVHGVRKTGRFVGPAGAHGITPPFKVAFVLGGDHFSALVTRDWNKHQLISLTRGGATEVLTSTWEAGTEEMCDHSGGTWDDDDPDPDTGLDCTCTGSEAFIPSVGGCTK